VEIINKKSSEIRFKKAWFVQTKIEMWYDVHQKRIGLFGRIVLYFILVYIVWRFPVVSGLDFVMLVAHIGLFAVLLFVFPMEKYLR